MGITDCMYLSLKTTNDFSYCMYLSLKRNTDHMIVYTSSVLGEWVSPEIMFIHDSPCALQPTLIYFILFIGYLFSLGSNPPLKYFKVSTFEE